jgi:hypothetical protein
MMMIGIGLVGYEESRPLKAAIGKLGRGSRLNKGAKDRLSLAKIGRSGCCLPGCSEEGGEATLGEKSRGAIGVIRLLEAELVEVTTVGQR